MTSALQRNGWRKYEQAHEWICVQNNTKDHANDNMHDINTCFFHALMP